MLFRLCDLCDYFHCNFVPKILWKSKDWKSENLDSKTFEPKKFLFNAFVRDALVQVL